MASQSDQRRGSAADDLRSRLQRRMRAIGIPPPERLMPGPIDPRGLQGNRTTAAPAAS
jgi:hypothetical protein